MKKINPKVSRQSFSSVFFFNPMNKTLYVSSHLILHVHSTAEIIFWTIKWPLVLHVWIHAILHYYTNIWVNFRYLSFHYAFNISLLLKLIKNSKYWWNGNQTIGKKIIKDATSTKSRLILHDNRHPHLPYTLIQTN